MEMEKIAVRLEGLSDIMFDRFIDYSTEPRPPEQKLYLSGENQLVLPAENIISFLFGEGPQGCAKWFEGKKGKQYIQMGMSHVFIDPLIIPIKSGDAPVVFKSFDNGQLYIYYASPRVKKAHLTIKKEITPRPVLKLPWSLEFTATIIKNSFIDETKLYNWFVGGGMQIALGTYRPRFGRFQVEKWESIA